MRNKLLYINDVLMDIYPDTVIAQTLQAFELGQVGSVRTNYTNQIKLPKTGTNIQTFEHSNSSKASTSFPYTSYTAKYIENGLEIIRNGRVILKETSEDFLLTIYSGPFGFFDFIMNKKLWDLDFTDLNGPWDDPDREGYCNVTTGIVAPLFDDGRIVFSSPNIENDGAAIKFPWIYYHTVIDKIFETAGFEKEGDIFADPAYLKLALPLSLKYSPAFTEAKAFSAAASGSQSIVNPAAYVDVTFTQVSFDGADNFYDGTSQYIVANADTPDPYFFAAFYSQIVITVAGGTVDIVFEITGSGPVSDTETNKGTGTYDFQVASSGMADGDTVKLKIIKNAGAPTVTVTSGVFYGVPRTGIDGDELITSIVAPYVYFNLLFEDINQIDFIKDFSVRFNVKMSESHGTIVCKTMDEILVDTVNMKDWTDKRVAGRERLKYAYTGLAQSNYMTYTGDDLTPDLPDDYAKGVFTIANENISEQQTIYESLFKFTEMAVKFGVFMAKIDTIPTGIGGNYTFNPGIRLCYLRAATAEDTPVIYDATPQSAYKVAYFIDPRYTYSMHWQYFIDAYYTEFVSRLQKAKAPSRNYFLHDTDINSFDQLGLVHDNGETFIVTKIPNYISGKLTEVELFRI